MILETFDHRDMWWEWWGDMAWPTKRLWQRQWQRQTQWQKHFENTRKERLWDFWSEWWGDMTRPTKKTMTMTIKEHLQRTIIENCELWDTDFIYDNWEQKSQYLQWPLNKEWQGQHSQFLRCLSIFTLSWLFSIFFGCISISTCQHLQLGKLSSAGNRAPCAHPNRLCFHPDLNFDKYKYNKKYKYKIQKQ